MAIPVDVLAVLARAYHHLAYVADASEAGSTIAIELSRAHAIVASLIANATELLRNAEYADGQGAILTQDAEALEADIIRCKGSQP